VSAASTGSKGSTGRRKKSKKASPAPVAVRDAPSCAGSNRRPASPADHARPAYTAQGTDRTSKSKEIGRVNSKYADTTEQRHQLTATSASAPSHTKHPTRRSREAPSADSETDDSEFLPQKKAAAPLPAPARSSGEKRGQSEPTVPAPPSAGKSTAYNTYLNVLAGSKAGDVRKDPSR
jgi:hypothetical protein